MDNPTPPTDEDDDAQGATSSHSSNSEDIPWYEGGGVLPESEEDGGIPLTFDNEWQERMHKTASPMPAESSLECVLLMIYSQIKRLADAVEKATDTTLILSGKDHE